MGKKARPTRSFDLSLRGVGEGLRTFESGGRSVFINREPGCHCEEQATEARRKQDLESHRHELKPEK